MSTQISVILTGWAHREACCICGTMTFVRWGVPVHNGDIVSNDFQGEWAASPVCSRCYGRHARGEVQTHDHLYTERGIFS